MSDATLDPTIFRSQLQKLVAVKGGAVSGKKWELQREAYWEYFRTKVTDEQFVEGTNAAIARSDRLPKPADLLALCPAAKVPETHHLPVDPREAHRRRWEKWREERAGVIERHGEPPHSLTVYRPPEEPVCYWYHYLQWLHYLDNSEEADRVEAWLTERGWKPGDVESGRDIVIPYVGPLGMQAATLASQEQREVTVKRRRAAATLERISMDDAALLREVESRGLTP